LFFGNCSLGRDFDEDRDHYVKKRLEMYGVLLSGIFKQLFRKFAKKVESNIKEQIKNNKDRKII
jgi:DNA-directed RNA polymerase beta subunit